MISRRIPEPVTTASWAPGLGVCDDSDQRRTDRQTDRPGASAIATGTPDWMLTKTIVEVVVSTFQPRAVLGQRHRGGGEAGERQDGGGGEGEMHHA